MRVFIVLLAVAAAASAASIATNYLPTMTDNSLPAQEYISPETSEEPATLADDGYHYKIVRKLKLRLRRDVNELPSSDYLPTLVDNQEELAVDQPISEEIVAVKEAPEEKTELADDGYRYKTVRRLKYRQRRDVNELPANKYLPPTEVAEEVPVTEPVSEEVAVIDANPEENTELAEDGYRYKTVRRSKYRHRRDVNELPANEYLPPTEVAEEVAVVEPVSEEVAVAYAAPEENTELAEDGYRYKTVRRLKYRHRRDVNEITANKYLPPTEVAEEVPVTEPVSEEVAVIDANPEENTELAEDGYRYKTVRRSKYRHRRDVNELPANEYLPPTEVAEEVAVVEPVSEEVAVAYAAPEENTELAEDGYRYKTVRRLKYRHRRDANEIPITEYLPPIEVAEEVTVAEPVSEEVAVINAAPEENMELAEDGYRYKTVRRLKYRHRRDVNELPANEYLPPFEVAEEVAVTKPVSEEVAVIDVTPEEKTELAAVTEPVSQEVAVINVTPEEKTELAEDGYRYKTVRRLKYRHRRDVNELPANEYLPPTEVAEEVAVVEPVSEEDDVAVAAPEEKTELDEDGYRYKTVRRLKYRHRRDVNELPANEYLPPTEVAEEVTVVEPVSEEADVAVAAPEEKTELDEDGYRYKTVRRLKYRHRRDINELPANEYLPPTEVGEEVADEEPISEEVAIAVAAPEENTELAADGYRYKTVRRLKYRHRRDVNELPANEYLPSSEVAEEVAVTEPVSEEVAVIDVTPEEKTELAEDGYRYKTVRRLKYRQRRDVNELPANEYLPPTEVAEEVAVVEPVSEEDDVAVAAPEEKTELAEDGYRYKTVRRLKYRHRRDINELPANEYLPPTEIAQEVAVTEPASEEIAVVNAVPEENTELAEDGYRYKTVRRLKYRQRRDVNELPANEYLPFNEIAQDAVADSVIDVQAPEETAVIADDGYRYKTVRRLKYRRQ